MFGVVEGGDILEERVRSARETAKRPVAGFCLDGLQTGSMDQTLRTQLITAMIKELPEDKPRFAFSWLRDLCELITAQTVFPIIELESIHRTQSGRTKQTSPLCCCFSFCATRTISSTLCIYLAVGDLTFEALCLHRISLQGNN